MRRAREEEILRDIAAISVPLQELSLEALRDKATVTKVLERSIEGRPIIEADLVDGDKGVIARAIAPVVLPKLAKIYQDKGIELRGDEAARALVPSMKPATEEDWYTEYLAAILAVRIVDGIDDAIEHIANNGWRVLDPNGSLVATSLTTEDEAVRTAASHAKKAAA